MYSNIILQCQNEICGSENEYVDVCSTEESKDENKENIKIIKRSYSNSSIKKTRELQKTSSLSPLNLSQNLRTTKYLTSIPTTSTTTKMEFKEPILLQKQSFEGNDDICTQKSEEIENGTDNEDDDDESDEEIEEEKPKTALSSSRKEKSLGKLCKRFLLAMCEEAKSGKDVHLETVSKKMNVEKRRIYDIVNVMEALEAMSKTNKSFYRWHGLAELPQLMDTLMKEAEEEKLPQRILRVEHAMCSFVELSSNFSVCSSSTALSPIINDCVNNASPSYIQQQKRYSMDSVGSFVDSSRKFPELYSFNNQQQTAMTRERNGKNSLAQLCRRFLMVLLCNPKDKRRVSLDVASTVLIKDPTSEGCEPPSRSRCRRLYDIANVLVAMGLIKKVHYLFGTKKIPLFVYCGPEPNSLAEDAHLSMMEFLSRIGLTSIGTTSNNGNDLQKVFEKPIISSQSALSTQTNHTTIRPKPTIFNNNNQSKTSLKRKHSNSPIMETDKENCRPTKISKKELNEKAQLPKPLPRFIQAQQQQKINSNFQTSTILQNLQLYQQQQQNQMAQQQVEQIFRVAGFLPYATSQQFSSLLWQQQQNLTINNNENKPPIIAPHLTTKIAAHKSPTKIYRQKVGNYSVSSILGVSQTENISPNLKITKSPRAFKPLNSSSKEHQQEYYSL